MEHNISLGLRIHAELGRARIWVYILEHKIWILILLITCTGTHYMYSVSAVRPTFKTPFHVSIHQGAHRKPEHDKIAGARTFHLTSHTLLAHRMTVGKR